MSRTRHVGAGVPLSRLTDSADGYANPADRARDEALAGRGLPPIAYVDNSKGIYDSSPVVAIKRGEPGFYPIHSRLTADELNAAEGVTAAQREAMLVGSMFGWHLEGASPDFHQRIFDRAARNSAA